jgi:hypothetical protein
MTSVNSGEAGDPGRSLSPRQERIAQRLFAQVGPGPAAFFRDACRLIAEGSTWRSATHLVAHLLREVESAVRSVLEPADADAGSHADKIRAVLTELGISHEDLVAEFWLGLAGKDNPQNLASRAHRYALEAPRPFNDEFLDYVDKVEQVLDAVLERFESNYFEIFERLDDLLATPEPTETHGHRLRQNFPHSEAVAHHFFSNASAAWVGPLHRAGFFAEPPLVQVDEDAGTVQFPPWPASLFLARIAAHAPGPVVEAVLAMSGTDNSRVNHDVVEIAAAVPAAYSTQLVPKVIAALGSRFGVLIPQRAGFLLAHLCRDGYVESAMDLAGALLKGLQAGYGPSASLHGYAYGEILRQHVPELVATAGAPALALLCATLDEVIRTDTERRSGNPGQDGSPLWRPNIEGYERRSESDLRHALVDAVRDAASSIVESDPSSIADIVAELESHSWLIFRRLALHLLSLYAGQACDLVAARLTDAAISGDWGLEWEYLLLARNGAACLDAAHLRRLLTLIDGGPAPTHPHTASPAGAGPETPDPMVRERIARWQRNRLAAVQKVLPSEWDARYQALVAEYGEAPDPGAPIPEPFAVRSWEGSVTAGELAAMPTDTLVDFLRTWQPPANDWPAVSPASVRGALSAAVQGDAERRSADAASFIGLAAEYVGAVINGLWQASANGAALDWDGVVHLSAWVNQQAEDELTSSTAGPGFRHWREPRMDMLRLLMAGLNPEPSPISADHDAEVWSVIEVSCQDPDPVPEREAERMAEEDERFMSLALNTVRAQAVRAAISYGLRLRRRSPDADLTQVRALLDWHLDRHLDPSCAVRSIYGELFPNLVWMVTDWATSHVEQIFPMDPGQMMLLDAAWGAYLFGGRPTEEAWPLLVGIYTVMVERMDIASQDRAQAFRARQMGRHLISRLWHGRLGVDSHAGLLRQFYTKVPPEVATELMWSIGVDLGGLETQDSALTARLIAFWEFRVAAVKSGADSRELAEFGRWFASGQFDSAWSLRQLLTTLSLTGRIEAEDAMLSRLANLAADHIQPCLAVLERWVGAAPHPWLLTQSLDNIRRILIIGAAGNPTAVQTSKRVISLLARDHGIDLRDVLRGETSA